MLKLTTPRVVAVLMVLSVLTPTRASSIRIIIFTGMERVYTSICLVAVKGLKLRTNFFIGIESSIYHQMVRGSGDTVNPSFPIPILHSKDDPFSYCKIFLPVKN